MTAIAYKDGVMAADSMELCGKVTLSTVQKITRRSKDGALAGAAGYGPAGEAFLRAFEAGEDAEFKRSLPNDEGFGFEAIIAYADGAVWQVGQDGSRYKVNAPFYVAGSAHEILVGAMAAGASAEQAVRIAVKYHASCGGDVAVLRHGEVPKEMGLIQCPIHGDHYSEDDRCPLCAEAASVLPSNGGGPAFCGLAFHQEVWLEANRPKIW